MAQAVAQNKTKMVKNMELVGRSQERDGLSTTVISVSLHIQEINESISCTYRNILCRY